MSVASAAPKNPQLAAAGRKGAEERWSDPANRRIVRLDGLTPEQRRLVLALVAAARSSEAAPAAA